MFIGSGSIDEQRGALGASVMRSERVWVLLSDGKDGVQNDGADIERGYGQVGARSAPSNLQESGRHWCQRDHPQWQR